jgi:hypothetical protein
MLGSVPMVALPFFALSSLVPGGGGCGAALSTAGLLVPSGPVLSAIHLAVSSIYLYFRLIEEAT